MHPGCPVGGTTAGDFSLWWARTIAPLKAPDQFNPFEDTSIIAEHISRWQEDYIRKGEARGQARSRAQGQALSIVQLARDGDLPRTKADLRLRLLHDQGLITSDDYLTQLG